MSSESRAIAGAEENRQRLEPGLKYAIEVLERLREKERLYRLRGQGLEQSAPEIAMSVAIVELRLQIEKL